MQKMTVPMMIAPRRPVWSPTRPARKLPKKAPAVNKDTIRPVSTSEGLLKIAVKLPLEMTSAMTPLNALLVFKPQEFCVGGKKTNQVIAVKP